MTDIVERLLKADDIRRGGPEGGVRTCEYTLYKAAADEIERLRAYNARLVVDACKAADEIGRLEAENSALLDSIVATYGGAK